MNNSVIKLLVGDCDGQGRSLEILYDSLTKKNIDDCKINDFMTTLQNELKSRYILAFSYNNEEAKQIIRAILTHIPLECFILKERITLIMDTLVCHTFGMDNG
jgi:hypothetical protein